MTDKMLRNHVALIAEFADKNSDKKIAYISGKVTGLDPEYVRKKFADDAEFVKSKGYHVFNPVDNIAADCDWKQAMKLCLAVLPLCDLIYIQPDAADSEGAQWEEQTAERLGIKIVYAPDFEKV